MSYSTTLAVPTTGMPDACGAEAACTSDAATGTEAAADVPAEEAIAGAEAALPAGVAADWLLPDGWQAESRRAMTVRTGNLFMAAVFLFNGKDGWIITATVGKCRLLFGFQDLFWPCLSQFLFCLGDFLPAANAVFKPVGSFCTKINLIY